MLKRQALFDNIFPLVAILSGCMLNDLQETTTTSKPDIYISSTVPNGNGGTLNCGVQMCSTPGFFCQTDLNQTIKIFIRKPAPEASNQLRTLILFYQSTQVDTRWSNQGIAIWKCPFYPVQNAYVSEGKLGQCLLFYENKRFHYGNVGVSSYLAVHGPIFGTQNFENRTSGQMVLINTHGKCN